MGFKHKDIIALQDLTRDEIQLLLDTAENMREVNSRDIKKVPTLRGKTIINLFYEASTRTRTSFEIAAKRLSADTVNISTSTSSSTKGRDASRHRPQPAGDEAGHHRHAPCGFGRALFSGQTAPLFDRECR